MEGIYLRRRIVDTIPQTTLVFPSFLPPCRSLQDSDPSIMVRKFGFELQYPLLGFIFLEIPDNPARLKRRQGKQNTEGRQEDRLPYGGPVFFEAVDFDFVHQITPCLPAPRLRQAGIIA